jgi:hypothetical protein
LLPNQQKIGEEIMYEETKKLEPQIDFYQNYKIIVRENSKEKKILEKIQTCRENRDCFGMGCFGEFTSFFRSNNTSTREGSSYKGYNGECGQANGGFCPYLDEKGIKYWENFRKAVQNEL